MKNIYIYYAMIIVPIGIILWLGKFELISSNVFVGLLFFYLLVYRTYIDGKRLVDKNVIPRKDIWKMIIPGKYFEFFKDLYLK